jgi:hypothetical protein
MLLKVNKQRQTHTQTHTHRERHTETHTHKEKETNTKTNTHINKEKPQIIYTRLTPELYLIGGIYGAIFNGCT